MMHATDNCLLVGAYIRSHWEDREIASQLRRFPLVSHNCDILKNLLIVSGWTFFANYSDHSRENNPASSLHL